MHTKDQRQYARHLVNIPVNFVVRGRSYKSWIRNISGGGVYIETGTLFPVQSVISMTYSLPDSGEENRIGLWPRPLVGGTLSVDIHIMVLY